MFLKIFKQNKFLIILVTLFVLSPAHADKSKKSKKSDKSKKGSKHNSELIQQLQDQVADLQTQIDALDVEPAHQGPYAVDVDCDAGESVNAALAAAPSSAASVSVYITGTCNENVTAIRSNTGFWAAAPGAAVNGGSGAAISNDSHDRIGIIGLALSGGWTAVSCTSGSMGIYNSTVTNSQGGLNFSNGCDVLVYNTTVDGGNFGVVSANNAVATLQGVTVTNVTNQAVIVVNNAIATLSGGPAGPSTISNSNAGMTADGGGLIQIVDAEVTGNAGYGIFLNVGGYLRVTDGANLKVTNNGDFGIGLVNNSTAAFWLDPVIEISGNGGDAVLCDESVRIEGNLTTSPTATISGAISPACPPSL